MNSLVKASSTVAMERWVGRVAVVTGASSGIGAAIARDLVKKGLKVVGLARRLDRLQVAAVELKDLPGELHAVQCDITKEQDILSAFKWVKEHLGGVDVMVNNAGLLHQAFLSDGETSEWREMLDVNVLGLSICTREAISSMKERGVTDGHIVHINSISGHGLPPSSTMCYMYGATKNAVTMLAEGLRRELVKNNSKIRVTIHELTIIPTGQKF
ncbi:dehydrogenase/reductase SDR family member 11-like isoform X2 [Periplaneta americana]|uniref:dehydrogenase/reductase SDR family member 11-like isoform X2 n=1 Tax=Periplaneta americana TaxID=6978 RepID=UPI0037E789A2